MAEDECTESKSRGSLHLILENQCILIILTTLCRRYPEIEEKDKIWSMQLFSFTDNDCFTLTESLLVQISLSSVIISKSDSNPMKMHFDRKLRNIFEKLDISITTVDESAFQRKDVERDVELLTGSSSLASLYQAVNRERCLSCLGCMIDQFGLMSGDFDGICCIESGAMGQCMRLDAAAMKAINLLPPSHNKRCDHYSSIFGVLNFTQTKMGERFLETMIRQPLMDVDQINNRLDVVELFLNDCQLRDEVRSNCLKGVADIDVVTARFIRYSKKPSSSIAALQDMHKMYALKRNFDQLSTCLSSCISHLRDLDTPLADNQIRLLQDKLLTPILASTSAFNTYCQLVEKVLDFDKLPDYCVLPQHDQDLEHVHDDMTVVEEEAKYELEQTCRNNGINNLSPKLETDKHHGFVLRTTKSVNEQELKRLNSSIRILQVLKGGVKFTTTPLIQLSNRYLNLKAEYESRQQRVIHSAVQTAASYVPMFEGLARVISQLDVYQSLATVQCQSSAVYCRPRLHPIGSNTLSIVDGRHPCVEKSPSVSCYIPNTYKLDKLDSSFHVITGPNMGGKSTFIRALGCIVVMAQIGSFVPCSSADITVIDCLLARIGSSDCQTRGISTFMAEMLDMSSITKTATSNSLILIDELGRGTSTSDGYGLAVAISEYIINQIQCFCLFASHFHELTSLEGKYNQVKNFHMTATMDSRSKKILFLYQILPGCSGQSWGIQIIEHVGFPESVIVEAKRKADQLERSEVSYNDQKKQRTRNSMIRFANMPLDEMSFHDAIEQCRELISEDV